MKAKQAKQTKAPEDLLVGAPAIARRLGVTNWTARKLMNEGAFGPLYDIGSGDVRARPRVLTSAVDAWIESRRISA